MFVQYYENNKKASFIKYLFIKYFLLKNDTFINFIYFLKDKTLYFFPRT